MLKNQNQTDKKTDKNLAKPVQSQINLAGKKGFNWSVIINLMLVISLSLNLILWWSFSQKEILITSQGTNSEELSIRQEIKNLVSQDFTGETPSQEEYLKAERKGLVSALNDPFSSLILAEDTESFDNNLNERYQGIGVSFLESSNGIVVDRVFRDSPAEKAGILKNDILKKVDGEDINNQNLANIAEKIRGEAESVVELEFLRGQENLVIKVTRSQIETELVYLDFRESVAVLEITSFGENLDQKMIQISQQIRSNNKINKILIDLRGNTGGLLDEAVDVASYFLEPNSVVLLEKEKNDEKEIRSTDKSPNLLDYKIFVLVDGGSASASEILAGSLKDQRNSLILGQTTFGKGVVQRLYDLPNGDKLKLTIAEWLTPNGSVINENGIDPDKFLNPSNQKDMLEQALDYIQQIDQNK